MLWSANTCIGFTLLYTLGDVKGGCIYSMDRNFRREECSRFSFRKAMHLACLTKPVCEAMDVNVSNGGD